MSKVGILFRNEVVKFFHNKKIRYIILFIMAMNVFSVHGSNEMANLILEGLEKTNNYSIELKTNLLNLSGSNFTLMFLTDIIYKPVISFYLIFILLIAVEVFSEDYESGTFKFTILTGAELKKAILAKFLFMAFISLLISLFSLVSSFIIGQLIYGGSIVGSIMVDCIILSVLVVVPAMALTSIIFVLTQLNLSTKVIMVSTLIFTFIINIADTFTKSAGVSPFGAVSVFYYNLPTTSIYFFSAIITSFFYVVIFSTIGCKIAKNKDIFK